MPEAKRSGGRPGRPARIDRGDVVAAALAVADEQGLEALGLRSVADRLGVTPAALYRLIDGPADLVAIVIEAAVDAATRRVELPDDWRGAVEQSARLLRKVLLEHPMLVEAYQQRPVVSSGSRKLIEQTMAALRSSGLDEAAVVEVYAAVQALVVGYVGLEHRRRLLSADSRAEWAGDITDDPRMARRLARTYFGAEGFEPALAMLLDGVAARIAGSRP
jgi:AcrR family transcriptional regulator